MKQLPLPSSRGGPFPKSQSQAPKVALFKHFQGKTGHFLCHWRYKMTVHDALLLYRQI